MFVRNIENFKKTKISYNLKKCLCIVYIKCSHEYKKNI